jgi:predicted nucleic acid-binding protein
LKYVLDADVLIGALDGSDSHHARSRELFLAWQQQGDSTLISVVNLSEVLIAPAADQVRLRAARRAIAALGVLVHSPIEAIGVEAARLRARHAISLADGYLLATARHAGATAVSFDRKIARAAAADGMPM